jgi:primosomal replication protein N
VKRNEVVIDGVAETGRAASHSGGIPAIDLLISHNSVQSEAGGRRQVRCELDAVALGAAAVSAARLRRNQPLRVNGFLAAAA